MTMPSGALLPRSNTLTVKWKLHGATSPRPCCFMPYNKTQRPVDKHRDEGVRQSHTFLVLYPRAEKCGIYASGHNRLKIQSTGLSCQSQATSKTMEKSFKEETPGRGSFKAIGDGPWGHTGLVLSRASLPAQSIFKSSRWTWRGQRKTALASSLQDLPYLPCTVPKFFE